MWQPRWEGSCGKNGYMYIYGWVPLPSTLNGDNVVCMCVWPCSVVSNSLVTPWTLACQAPLSMGFFRQEYWSGLPFPSPEDLPAPMFPVSPALQADSWLTEPLGKPPVNEISVLIKVILQASLAPSATCGHGENTASYEGQCSPQTWILLMPWPWTSQSPEL